MVASFERERNRGKGSEREEESSQLALSRAFAKNQASKAIRVGRRQARFFVCCSQGVLVQTGVSELAAPLLVRVSLGTDVGSSVCLQHRADLPDSLCVRTTSVVLLLLPYKSIYSTLAAC
jgi:hypothetical protein